MNPPWMRQIRKLPVCLCIHFGPMNCMLTPQTQGCLVPQLRQTLDFGGNSLPHFIQKFFLRTLVVLRAWRIQITEQKESTTATSQRTLIPQPRNVRTMLVQRIESPAVRRTAAAILACVHSTFFLCLARTISLSQNH